MQMRTSGGSRLTRAERAHRHSLVGSVRRFRRHHRHAGGKSAEYAAELVWTDAQFLIAGEMKSLNRKRGSRATLAGMKSPATPTSKSAMSLLRERAFAALLRK